MSDDHPITLAAAAKEFGFGVPTLRAEAERGHLTIYRIGNRFYTTRSDIRAMVKACRVEQKARDFTLIESDRSGSSVTEHISSARAALKATLNARGHS